MSEPKPTYTAEPTVDERNDGNDLTFSANTAESECHPAETVVDDTVRTPTERPLTNNVSANRSRPDTGGELTPTSTKRQSTVRTCENCGREIVAVRPNRRFCGPSCRRSAWLERNPERAAELAASDKERLRRHIESRGGTWVERHIATVTVEGE